MESLDGFFDNLQTMNVVRTVAFLTRTNSNLTDLSQLRQKFVQVFLRQLEGVRALCAVRERHVQRQQQQRLAQLGQLRRGQRELRDNHGFNTSGGDTRAREHMSMDGPGVPSQSLTNAPPITPIGAAQDGALTRPSCMYIWLGLTRVKPRNIRASNKTC